MWSDSEVPPRCTLRRNHSNGLVQAGSGDIGCVFQICSRSTATMKASWQSLPEDLQEKVLRKLSGCARRNPFQAHQLFTDLRTT